MKKIICIILTSILISVAFVSAKTELTPMLMAEANYGMNRIKTMEEIDMLFVGSSMFRQGIDTGAIENGTDSVFLLSYNGNQPFAIYREIKEITESGVKINNLYVDMYAYTLTSPAGLSDLRIIQDVPMRFTLSIYKEMNNLGQADFSDFYEMAVSANNEVFITWPISFPLINKRYNNGSNLSKNTGSTEEKLKRLSNNFGSTDVNETQKKSIEDLISLCKEKNINIFFLETPKYSYLYEKGIYCEIMKKYSSLLNELECTQIMSEKTAENCGITEDDKHMIYSFDNDNPGYFTDLIHLSYDGRNNLSTIIKNRLDNK